MYCASYRWNYLLTYLFIALGCAFFVCFISTCNADYKAKANIKTNGVYLKRHRLFNEPWKFIDSVFLTFDLQTDLTHLFDWNVKQLVISLAAEYETRNSLEQLILWDRIILKGQNAKLYLRNEPTQYNFWDDGNEGLRGHTNVTLFLSCNIIPNVGNVPNIIAQGSHSFKFPENYTFLMYR